MEKIFIIDGNSLLNRAFYALPLLSNANGEYSNAVFGFVNCIIKLITEEKPDYMVVAFDHARKTFRNEIFAEYKGTRKETPTELIEQFGLIRKVLSAMGIFYIEQEGIEADDIIGTITKNSGIENYIISGDRDLLQLINSHTRVWLTQKGITDIKEVNEKNIESIYNLTPAQIIEFKALAGDSSDNIPGIPGIGEKTAITLLSTYGKIDNLYNNLQDLKGKQLEKIVKGKELCYISKKLATIKTDCEINFKLEDCKYSIPFPYEAKELFEKYDFKTILKRKTLFNEETVNISLEYTSITSKEQCENAIKNIKNFFAFDIKENIYFSIDNENYVIDKLNLGYMDDHSFLEYIKQVISPVIKNNKILKIVQDLKMIMHKLDTDEIFNVFDLNLANYLILGGNKPEQIKHCSEFYCEYKKCEEKLKIDNLYKLYNNIELPLVYVLYNMEKDGFALDKNMLYTLKNSYSAELNDLENQIKSFSQKEDFNPKSPKQVAMLLFDELKLPDKQNKKHSTNVEALELLESYHQVVPLLLRYRKVVKLYTTYIEPYIQILENSTTNIIHTIFNQTLTATGRLSSSEPNVQNIPARTEEGRNLRKLFVSRFEGGKLISADYNQIELRLLANFSQDEKLIADYNKGTDIHRLTASQIFEISPEAVTDIERRMAKAVNFGIIYGMSGYGLARNIDMPVKEAKKYIEIYFAKYPGVKQYLDGLVTSAKELGYARTLYNRRRYIPELQSNNGLQRSLGERIAMNMPLQGSASDIIKIAMLNLTNRFKKEQIKSKLILQIHDELIIDVFPGEEAKVQDILIAEMQNAYISKVPLLVGVGMGETWFDCK